ncbi:MAG: 4-(cytidine 5'-diphospho)-2-C-methyl-D-erythritol kinase [Fibrobacter sp.]|nr:4-(cytidine 5'-diphospho)-2-C-methyl-D-erythritol kinase [Fibrobacter sp.]
MKEYAPAKINLFLDVIRKREDGYHDLGTVFQTVDAGDTLTLEARNDGVITLEYNQPQDYPKESDLVYKAAVALKNYAVGMVSGSENTPEEKLQAENLGADLYLEKVMPLGAGLGGGSADAAATLRGLNRLWNLNLPATTLEEIGAKLGADVPFLVRGGTAFAEGIGERLTFKNPLQLSGDEHLLIATPLDAVPTKDAYAGVPKSGPDRWENFKGIMNAECRMQNSDFLVRLVNFNAFETSVFPKHPLVASMKEEFVKLGARATLMSGSGASVFGIFPSRESAERASEALKSISRYRKVTRFFTGFAL